MAISDHKQIDFSAELPELPGRVNNFADFALEDEAAVDDGGQFMTGLDSAQR